MRLALVLIVAAAVLAGCSARGEKQDPFAYTKKPLYTGHFDLATVPSAGDGQMFRVDDGSIGSIRVSVWINATAGGGHVTVTDPSGKVVLSTSESTQQAYPLELGVWKVRVTSAAPGSAGSADLLVTR